MKLFSGCRMLFILCKDSAKLTEKILFYFSLVLNIATKSMKKVNNQNFKL